MRVIVSRSGGIAGMHSTWQVVIDSLPDAQDWIVLIADLPWDDVPKQRPRPDRFVYRIRCEESDLPPVREAVLGERDLTGPWRELVDRVRSAGSPMDADHPQAEPSAPDPSAPDEPSVPEQSAADPSAADDPAIDHPAPDRPASGLPTAADE